MKNLLLAFSLLVLCACDKPSSDDVTTTVADASQTDERRVFDMPYLMRELDNGLKVIIVKTDFPDVVTIQIPVQTGSRNEVEPGKSGFAHFFEHMMFRGTERFPAAQYNTILQNAGADQNAYTTDDFTNYHITFTKEDLETVIELEADRFMNLRYSEEDFRTEALAVKGEYLKNYSNPIQKLLERLREVAFDQHTYQHTTMGFLADIEDMPNQKAYADIFFDRWYRPEKAAVILVGDLDPEATFELVKQYWGVWERGDYNVEIPVEPTQTASRYDHIQWQAPTQPWYTVSFRGPAFSDERMDMAAMDILSSIYFSASSDLYQDLVVKEQWVDQLFAYFPDRKDPYLLMIAARLTDEAVAPEVRDRINAEIARMRREPVSASTLDATKSRLRYGFTAQLDNSGSIGATLASYVQIDRDPETINRVYAQYDKVTAEDLTRLANQYFVETGRTTLTLSNNAEMAGVDGKSPLDALTASVSPTEPDANDETADLDALLARAALEPFVVETMRPVQAITRQSLASPLVDVSFVFATGAAFDPAGKKGLASLTAAMLANGGSEALPIADIEAALYPMAAGFGAQVDKEMIRLAGQVHKDNLDAWYQLISGQLLTPGWRESDLARLKTQLINGIRTGLVGSNDEELAKELLYTQIYPASHPYGGLNLGDISDIESITLEDVKQFYEQQFTLPNLTLGLAGGYADAFVDRVIEDLQALPDGERNALPVPPVQPAESRRALVIQKETPAVAVSFGMPIDVRRGDPDWVALWLARSYLGEHRSSNSYLYKRIRETRGMNYGDYAYIEYFPRGMFQFYPDANLGRQQQIFQVWVRPLRSNNDALFATRVALYELEQLIENGMDEAEFEAARNYLSKYVSQLTKTQSRQLGYAVDADYYGTDAFADYVRDGLAALTLDDVNAAVRKHWATEGLQFTFISRDADGLIDALVNDTPSPITYNTDKPAELLAEDARLQDLPFGLEKAAIERRDASSLFE
ncbi:MAG: pitrilysin family protein [Pseudomonadota bacterium]